MAIEFVAFDLDGTLVRGPGINCGSVVAHGFGHPEWTERMEMLYMRGETPAQMRERVAPWLAHSVEELCRPLVGVEYALGADDAFALLHERGITTAIASLAFDFIVEWFVERFGVDYWIAPRFNADGSVTPFWPEQKGPWLEELTERLGLSRENVAAVGDSVRDAEFLRAAGHPFFVGEQLPPELVDVPHHPNGDLLEIARIIVSA